MPRKPRPLVDNGYYHLIGRGNNGLNIFTDPSDFKMFKSLIYQSKKKFSWKLHHYCLMPNHFHLLGCMIRGSDLPKLMQFLIHGYSRYYGKKKDYIGHLWQGRYKSPLIEEESYMLECARYIERNPVRAGIVKCPEDYPWSSYQYYAFGTKDILVEDDPHYDLLGFSAGQRQSGYRNFIRIEEEINAKTPLSTPF